MLLLRRWFWLFWFGWISLWSQNRFSFDSQVQRLDSASEGAFDFVIIGDRTGVSPDGWAVFDQAVAEINLLRPDFCVMVGDLIEGATDQSALERQWEEAERHLAVLESPLFLLPGNHDIPNPRGYAVWNEHIGKTYGSFDFRGCRFLFLNTEEFQGTGESGFGHRQLAYTERILADVQRSRLFFLFMHQPAWFGNGTLKTQWSSLERSLPPSGTISVAGHLHALAMKKQGGRSFLITGPTGGKLRLERNPALGLMQHVTWVAVKNGTYRLAFLEVGRLLPEQTALEAYDRTLKGLLLLKY
ncbi:MAG TPA: metallophosphoesterase [bacterium]